MILIRIEQPEDTQHVRFISEQAFEQPAEANIVDRLRQACPTSLSLAVKEDNRLIGHILFSSVEIESTGCRVIGMGLASMAVRPVRQQQGIGSARVRRGHDIVREKCCPLIIFTGITKKPGQT